MLLLSTSLPSVSRYLYFLIHLFKIDSLGKFHEFLTFPDTKVSIAIDVMEIVFLLLSLFIINTTTKNCKVSGICILESKRSDGGKCSQNRVSDKSKTQTGE